jgi:nitric oxide dioxygenase
MLSAQTIEIVESTIPLLAEQGEAITRHFYDKLLTENPELNNVFNPANQAKGGQARALADAVFAYANNLNNLEALLPAVARIAHKHVSLGVTPEQYPIIGGALLSAIQEVASLPDEHPALVAWGEAYGVLAEVFINAEEELYQANEKATGGWRGFREFVIENIVSETHDVKSFYLKPKDGGTVPTFNGGQYVGLKADLEGETYVQIRQYSLSAQSDPAYLRITTKAEPSGRVSNYLHGCEKGATVYVQAPTGVFNLDKQAKNHVFLAGGVGITPLMGMLHEALNTGIKPSNILFVQAQQEQESEIFKTELADLQRQWGFHYQAQFSGGEGGGYVNDTRLKQWLIEAEIDPADDTAVYTCGPKLFMAAMKQHSQTVGVEEQNIHYEVFGPTTAV